MESYFMSSDRFFLLLLLMAGMAATSHVSVAQDDHLIEEWILWPNNTLGQAAANYPGPSVETPSTAIMPLYMQSPPFTFFGEQPTERVENALADSKLLPTEAFTAELWLVDHVNQPVGTLVMARGKEALAKPGWVFGYYDDRIYLALESEQEAPFVLEKNVERGWKSYWHHLAVSYDGRKIVLYWNGEAIEEVDYNGGSISYPEYAELELAAYLNHEPYMQLADLVKSIRLYDAALSQQAIQARFESLQNQVNEGILFPDLFHFNAGPYLNFATQNSINLLWETDKPATATIEYGQALPLDHSLRLDSPSRIQEITIDGLEPQTTYFYRILAQAEGEEINSGVLSFQTAVLDGTPFSFAIIGDTEARPHINSRLSKLIWGERPNFMLNVGDLTDGGMQHHKFEWNYEYFVGMTQLNSRVPVFPVPGNGEADLFWYNQYHVLPEPEAYYSFRYGNAEFFMLDSNQRRESFAPGGEQYEWLEQALSSSNATWKFVAHHHPTYTMEENDYGNSWVEPTTLGDLDARQILPLYEGLGVDMVFFGHIHSYERTMPIRAGMVDIQNGVVHLLAGGGGGNLEDFAPTRSWFTRKVYRGHHYALVDLHDQQLTLTMYDTEGGLRDRMEIRKDLPPSPYMVSVSDHDTYLKAPQKIRLSTSTNDIDIRYTLDGTTPTNTSPLYQEPVSITEPSIVTAASFRDHVRMSTVSRARFQLPPAPSFVEKGGLFVQQATVAFKSILEEGATIRYTTDGSKPTTASTEYTTPIQLTETKTVTAATFWPSGLSSASSVETFVRANYKPADELSSSAGGLQYAYYQGLWPALPNFESIEPVSSGVAPSIDVFSLRQRDDHFGIVYTGFVEVPTEGIYAFYLASDDGSQLFIGDTLLIDNDGQHGVAEKMGEVALQAGYHSIRIEYFEYGGGESLSLEYEGPGILKQPIPAEAYVHNPDLSILSR